MPTQNRYYSSSYLATSLPGGAAASGSVVVSSVTGSPAPNFPFTMLLDWGLTTQEAISVTAISGTGPYTLTCTRGIDGTTAQSHSANAIAVHGVTEQDFSEAQVHINATGSTVDPESGNTIAVHGLQSGSVVVGTTDTQTLTNKTLTSPTITGATFSGTTTITGNIIAATESLSAGSATGAIFKVTNTTSAPSGANVQWVANAATDLELGINVAGDTAGIYRLQALANGKLQWGPGGSAAVDTDLYRSGVGALTTDGSLTAGTTVVAGTGITATTGNIAATAGNVTAGAAVSATTTVTAGTGLVATTGGITVSAGPSTIAGNTQLAGSTGAFGSGTGVVGLSNASVVPTVAASGGVVLYATGAATASRLKWLGGDGNAYQTGSFFVLGSAVTGSSGTSAQSVTGLSATLGVGTYQVCVMLSYSPQATVGSTNTFQFAFSGTSTSANLNGVCSEGGGTTAAQVTTVTGVFTTPTHVAGGGSLTIWGQIVVSVAGTLQLQFTNTTTGDLVNIVGGSMLEIQPIA